MFSKNCVKFLLQFLNLAKLQKHQSLSPTGSLYQTLVNVILKSDKTIEEKAALLNDLQKESLLKERLLYKLHYQQLLTIRSVIKMFEKSFGKQNHLSRIENWKKYLANSEHFKPFEEIGLTEDGVSTQVDMLFKSHSADIHFLKTVEGFSLEPKGFLTAEQEKIVKILIGNSPWKHLIKIV